MSMARRCDICKGYFDLGNLDPYRLDYEEKLNYIHLHGAKDPEDKTKNQDDYRLHFDACPKCYDDVLTYVLTRRAEAEAKEESYV